MLLLPLFVAFSRTEYLPSSSSSFPFFSFFELFGRTGVKWEKERKTTNHINMLTSIDADRRMNGVGSLRSVSSNAVENRRFSKINVVRILSFSFLSRRKSFVAALRRTQRVHTAGTLYEDKEHTDSMRACKHVNGCSQLKLIARSICFSSLDVNQCTV